jgi:hypothetical protein
MEHENNIINELYKRLSELIIRVKKLEQYQRLQEDINRSKIHYISKPQIMNIVKPIDNCPETKGLSFEQAIIAFKKGRTIKRTAWPAYDILKMYEKDIIKFELTVVDIISNDWEIID